MAKGGARVGAGRPAKEQSRAKDRAAARVEKGLPSRAINDGDWLMLPRAGRKGNAPAWPLSKPDRPTLRSRSELALWRRLWKSPQALGWEKVGVDHDQIALYVRYRVEAEEEDSKVGTRIQVRQYADALGLTAPGLRSLHWRIGQPAAGAGETPKPPAPQPHRPAAGASARERFLQLVQDNAAG